MNKVFGLYDTDPVIKPLQRMLNEKLSMSMIVDGNIGKITQDAIFRYQQSIGIIDFDKNGACYGVTTQEQCKPFILEKYLQEDDFINTAKSLGIELAVLKAITLTEAKEFGFFNNGFPVILFERHKFYNFLLKETGMIDTAKIFIAHPDICNARAGGYIGGEREITRLNKAISINETAALLSASYGLFQIMGFNFSICGYKDVNTFVSDMKASERNQLKAFTGFVKSQPKLLDALKVKNWPLVARLYNGPTYAQNSYDKKLEFNYKLSLK